MSKYHAVSSGMVTRQALPSITRQRGTTTGSANLMLYGAGKTYAIGTNTTFTDSSANAFTVTRNGDTIQATANPFTGSVVFDGNGDYLSVADNSAFEFAAGDFTIEAYLYVSSFTAPNNVVQLFGQWGPSAGNYSCAVLVTAVEVSLAIYNTSGSYITYTSTTTINTGAWNHIAVSRSGSNLFIFLNGTQIGSTHNISTNNIASTATNSFLIGYKNDTAQYLNGYISNLRVVKGTAVYTANFTPPTSPLTAITNTSLLLLAGQQAPFRDSSSNAFTVTANGNAAGSGVEPPSFVPYAGSGYFDGNGDYLSLANNAAFDFGTGNFTVECWVNINSVSYVNGGGGRGASVFSATSGFSGNGWNLEIGGNSSGVPITVNFNSRQGSSQVTVSANVTMANGTWYHIAVVRSGTLTSIYLNGVSVGSGTLSNQTITSVAALWVGGQDITNYQHWCNGYISNARVVKGTAVYTANFTPSAAPLTAITNTSLLLLTNNVGPFIDSSANGFPVLRNGDAVQSGFNPFSQASSGAGYFDGNGDFLSIANNTAIDLSSGSWTIECWVYWTGTNVNADFLNKDGVFAASYPSYALSINSSTPRLTIGSGNGTSSFQILASSLGTLPTNTWVHLAGVRSGSTIYLFQNGQLAASATVTATITNGSKALIVGYQTGQPTSSYMDGYISNARVVKGTALYTSNFTPPTSPLTAITNTSLLLLTDNYSIVNSTSTNLPVTINGNTTISTAQYPTGMSSSIYFDGTGDYLSLPANAAFSFGTGDYTVEFWVYMTSYGSTNSALIDFRGSTGFPQVQPVVYLNFSTKELELYPATGKTTGAFPLNTWTHIATTRSASVVKLFVNGTQAGPSSTDTTSYTNSSGVFIAAYAIGPSQFLNGYMSNIRVCKGTALYTANFTVPSAPLSTTVTVPNFVTNNIYGLNQIP